MTTTTPEPGCIIDGHHGWHAHAMMVDYAASMGCPLTAEDLVFLYHYRRGETLPSGEETADYVLNQGGLMDVCEDWLNENIATEGFSFGWNDGDFGYYPNDDEEDSE